MKILKLRASFGKLRDELELKEGYNELYLPNEAGKSTWSAFVVAMLYGIDTSERASAQNQGLPAKERYKPWDGRAMEGSMELQWQGRHITIERSAAGRTPMGNFRAYDTQSGVPIAELTGENCGQMLCGVERSVFERSAFIRQLGLSVTPDTALDKRLGALVTTGTEDGMTYSELEKELKNRRNKLTGRAGRLPRLLEEKERVERELRQLYELQEQAMELTVRTEQAEKEQSQRAACLERQIRVRDIRSSLKEIETLREEAESLRRQRETAVSQQAEKAALLARIAAAKEAQKQAGLQELEQKIARQEAQCRALEETTATLPPSELLHSLRNRLAAGERNLQTAKMDAVLCAAEVQKPMPPRGFGGQTAQEVRVRAEQDEALYASLSQVKRRGYILPLLLSLVMIAGGIGLLFVRTVPGVILGVVGLLVLLMTLLLRFRSRNITARKKEQVQELALRYGLENCGQLRQIGEDYAQQLEKYRQDCARQEAQRRELEQSVIWAQEELDQLVAQVCAFAPDCHGAEDCAEALSAALHAHEERLSQLRELESLRRQYSSLLLVLGNGTPVEADPEALAMDEARIVYEERLAVQTLTKLNSRLDQLQGAISARPDEAKLRERLTQLTEELREMGAEPAEPVEEARQFAERDLRDLRSRLDQTLGAIAAQGDSAAMEARVEQLTEAAEATQIQVDAIDIALEALKEADEALRSRFSPQITAEAGKLLAELTGEKYQTLVLAPDLKLSVRETGGAVSRPAAAMSCGTADQMYLALRLAMSHQLLPADTPLVFDDALVNFDETRATAALELLKKEAETRQVILFTCRKFQ